MQAPAHVVMVRPHNFVPNPETIADNLFQPREPIPASRATAEAAFREVTAMAQALEAVGVHVHVFEDADPGRPDSVFPNNWFSTHPDGRVALYPMYSPNRRAERRPDIIASLRSEFRITSVHDYSLLEDDDLFLEGTGSMVLDHLNGVAYVARSFRSHDRAVRMVCRDLQYEPVLFSTVDRRGAAIYHTNVMMSVGTKVALVALESIPDPAERREVEGRLTDSGRVVVPLSSHQIDQFAGNVIEVTGGDGPYLVVSTRALEALQVDQRRQLTDHLQLLPVSVPTVELAGGSVRCMIAGVHLEPRARRP